MISIHALLAESDSGMNVTSNFKHTFLSTLSLRRATANWFDLWGWAEYFYPRSPCGERPGMNVTSNFKHTFLSTLSLRRATLGGRVSQGNKLQFLSTLSLRRATNLAELNIRQIQNFYPRSPCGERHFDTLSALAPEEFLSTLSLRRATRQRN